HAGLPGRQQSPPRAHAEPVGARDPILAGRQPLPVHGVRQNRERGAGRGRDAEKGIIMAETLTNGHTQSYVGTRTIRPDGADKVTGRARFGADFSLPGQLIGKVLRSPHAHAVIKSIDTRKAEALAGVKAVVTAKDFPEQANLIVPTGEMQVNLRDITRN